MAATPIHLGDIFSSVQPPRREWRVVEAPGAGHFTLECVDKPSSLRFLDASALLDSSRYVRK